MSCDWGVGDAGQGWELGMRGCTLGPKDEGGVWEVC
jgi:hypothetical protein